MVGAQTTEWSLSGVSACEQNGLARNRNSEAVGGEGHKGNPLLYVANWHRQRLSRNAA